MILETTLLLPISKSIFILQDCTCRPWCLPALSRQVLVYVLSCACKRLLPTPILAIASTPAIATTQAGAKTLCTTLPPLLLAICCGKSSRQLSNRSEEQGKSSLPTDILSLCSFGSSLKTGPACHFPGSSKNKSWIIPHHTQSAWCLSELSSRTSHCCHHKIPATHYACLTMHKIAKARAPLIFGSLIPSKQVCIAPVSR